ncbi:MAG: alpha/beta fold hydrolase [Rhizobiaceae bacterium]
MNARLHSNAIDNSNASAIPVVFLHGFGGLGAQWWGLQTAVSFKAPTVAFDLPGHGKSLNFPEAGPPKTAARAVLSELDARDLPKVHLVGHSMGGAVSSLIALMAPERVASMTLLAPGGYGNEVNHEVLHKWAAAKQADELSVVLTQFFGPEYVIQEKMIDFQVELRSANGAVEKLTEIAELLFSGGQQGKLPVEDVLAKNIPTSVVWGELDAIVPVHQSTQLEGRVDLHVVPGVGHSPLEEAPDLVRQLVLQHVAAG